MENFDFSGYATRINLKCSDGRTIMKDAFKHNDGKTVPLVWNHQHNDPNEILGHALLENREDGVYAYCKFNDTESGQTAKLLVQHGDVSALSIYANQLKQQGPFVTHGSIREVSLVLAGANPGAFIDSIIKHGEESEEEAIIFPGDDNCELRLCHADSKKEDKNNDEVADDPEKDKEPDKKEETVADILDTLTDKQMTAVYHILGLALENNGEVKHSDEEPETENETENETETETEEEIKHAEGGNEEMNHNVFENETEQNTGVLCHADQAEIISLAKTSAVGSLKAAMEIYAANHSDTLKHGWDEAAIAKLFPDYEDVRPGAPELLERDQSWVAQVMRKAHKSPISRVRTRQADARANELRAKGYNNRETAKRLSGDIKLIMRTTDPQTVYRRDELHRDDIIDITDFDVVAYQKTVMRHNLEEDIALAALVGDGREDTDPDKIHENHIRSIWNDDELYCIHTDVDIAAARTELQGTNTGANFGENYIYAEAIITAALYAREKYKGKGQLDFFCTPHLLNVMLLARDLNGRRIYDSKDDLAKALNVGEIYTVEQFEGRTRTTNDPQPKTKKLLGIFVNMANYQFGSTKGGEITNFDDFDIDFNKYKYLMETRLSGALTDVYSAIALEEDVTSPAG